MDSKDQISTWELLRSLGFEDDPEVISDKMPGLSYDFEAFTLSASQVLGREFATVVMLTGCLETKRRLVEICSEIPLHVDSREQGIAWITYLLDKAVKGGPFESQKAECWLAEGRRSRHLLPWNK